MAKIDWKARMSNKAFWVALVPALIILAQFVMDVVGIGFDVVEAEERALDLVNAAFTILAILGIVVDTSTKGLADESDEDDAASKGE